MERNMQSPTSVNLYPNKFIKAGAGAGKTTTLIKTFFDFVEHYRSKHNKLPRVIITTFTRKATQEVKERLLEKAITANDVQLIDYINKKSLVHISTIHGVLSLFLNRFHDVIGFPSELSVVDEKTLYKTYKKCLKSVFKNNPLYLTLLEHYTFKELLELILKADLFIRETKATSIQKEDLIKIRKAKQNQAVQILSELNLRLEEIGQHKSWTEYSSFLKNFYKTLQHESFDEIYRQYSDRPNKPRFYSDKPYFDNSLHDLIKQLFESKANYFSVSDTDTFIDMVDEINKLFNSCVQQYSDLLLETKKVTGQISIADLELLSLELIRQSPKYAEEFSSQYDYYMIDEYQDTSPLQVQILEKLTEKKSHFVVGDPQQSIYLFRGARSEVFHNKYQKSLANQDEIIHLETNYRSDEKLMNFINDTVTKFSSQFVSMNPKPSDDSQNSIQGYFVKTDNEYLSLARHIKRLSDQDVKLSDICILFNKNSDILDFSKFAQKLSLPVQPLIAAGYDKKREVLDLLSFLRFLVNPHDNFNLVKLLRSPWFEVSDDEICLLRSENSQLSLWNQIKSKNSPVLSVLNSYLSEYIHFGVLSSLQLFLNRSGFIKNSFLIDSSGQREANIYKFISILESQMSSKSFQLNQFLNSQFGSFQDDLSSNLNEAVPVMSQNRVLLMTIHGAKGLQFKHVFLAGLSTKPKSTNRLPFAKDEMNARFCVNINFEDPETGDTKLTATEWSQQQKMLLNKREQEEYERLFYVAMTRAEKSISFFSDINEKNYSGTWQSKILWPAEGTHHQNNYTVLSLNDVDCDEPITFNFYQSQLRVIDKLTKPSENQSDQFMDDSAVSVTELVELKNKSALSTTSSSFGEQKIISNLNKAQKGTELHRVFESMKYKAKEDLLKNMKDDEKSAVEYLLNLQEIPFLKILENGFTEWGFGLRTQLGVLQGQIDLWGALPQEEQRFVYILDYKTGSSDYSDKALLQLESYAQCLLMMGKIQPTDQLRLVALYPFERKIKILDKKPKDLNPI